MARQYWVAPVPPFPITDGAAYATSTTLTDVAPTPQIVIPSPTLEASVRVEFSAFGRYSTTTGTNNITLGIYSGTVGQAIASAVAVVTTSAITGVASSTNRTWRLEGNGSVRTIGTSGTILCVLEVSNITSNGTDMAPATAPAAATIDTTVSRYFTLGATWSVSNAANSLTCHYFGMRLVN